MHGARKARKRSGEIGRNIIERLRCEIQNGSGRKKRLGFDAHAVQLQVNCVHRADSEPRVHKEFKNDVRFASRTNVLSNKEMEKVNCSCGASMFENSNRSE